MRNYNKALIIVAALIVGGGIGFVITGFVTSGSIEDSFNFTYEPISPDPVEDLTFNVDLGSILFKYNTSPTASFAKIDVNMKITGLYMAGKTYLNFFHPSTQWWDNTTNTFNLITLPDIWFDPSHWFKSYNISVTVTLRTDVVYDLVALSSIGSIEMQVPDGVVLNGTSLTSSTGAIKLNTLGNNEFLGRVKFESSTGKVESFATKTNFTKGFRAETSTGELALNYTNCVMSDDLKGTTSTGKLTFKSYNMIYTEDINLDLESSTGNIYADLYQYITMGENITGVWKTSTGSVYVLYKDNLVNTGVKFTGSTSTGSFNYTPHPLKMDIDSNIYSSLNYVNATYRYDFSIITSTGSITADAQIT